MALTSISKTYIVQRLGWITLNDILNTQLFEIELIPISNTQAESYVVQQFSVGSPGAIWAVANLVLGGTVTLQMS